MAKTCTLSPTSSLTSSLSSSLTSSLTLTDYLDPDTHHHLYQKHMKKVLDYLVSQTSDFFHDWVSMNNLVLCIDGFLNDDHNECHFYASDIGLVPTSNALVEDTLLQKKNNIENCKAPIETYRSASPLLGSLEFIIILQLHLFYFYI